MRTRLPFRSTSAMESLLERDMVEVFCGTVMDARQLYGNTKLRIVAARSYECQLIFDLRKQTRIHTSNV
jgi:hypothetical protein